MHAEVLNGALFEIISSLEKFYLGDFLVIILALTQCFSFGSPLSFLILLNLTLRIISGNGRKQVSVYRRLYKLVKLLIYKFKRGFRSKLRFIKSFDSFQLLVFLPRSRQLLSSRNSIAYLSFAKSASLKFFFETVFARRTISNLKSSLLKFRVNVVKAWFVLLNFD